MVFLYIVLGIIALFFLLQLSMILKMKMKKGKEVPSLNGAHGRLVKKGDKVLMYFHSPGCRACISMTPIIKALAKKHKNIFSINVKNDMDTAQKLGVMATPSIVIIEKGIIKEFKAGALGESGILALLN